MATAFSETLCRIREEEGFPTAYRFFHGNGGVEALGFTYRQYLRMEQGKNLPSCEKLHKLILALRTTTHSTAANELAAAWLRTTTGEEVYNSVFGPLIQTKKLKTDTPPMHSAMKSALKSKKHYITPGQFRVILADPATFLCFTAMQNDTGLWPVDQVAQTLRLTQEAAHNALKRLAQARLLRRVREGVYKCPLVSMMIEYPRLDGIEPALREKLFKYQRDLMRSGSTVCQSTGIIRANAHQFRQHYVPLLALTVSTAETYNATKKSEDSALFYIEGRVVKLRDF